MNYKESKVVLGEIKKAKKILLNCHRSPDPDAVGSATAMYQVLTKMGKNVKVVTPSGLPEGSKFIPYSEKVDAVNFSKFDFNKFDFCIFLDSSSWDMVTDKKNLAYPKVSYAVIDHHDTNSEWGTINIVDKKRTSTAEIIYLVFKDWGIKIDKNIASSLMAGVIGDTGAFRFPGVGVETMKIGIELMKLGVDKDNVVFNIYQTIPFNLIKFYSEALSRVEIDKKNKFVWTSVPYEVYSKLSKPESARESTSSLFAQIVEDTEFGFVMVEQEKGKLLISFRSRTGFDTSKIAQKLGGGGHVYASGAKVEGLPFEKAVARVLKVVRSYAKEYLDKQKSSK